MTVGQIGLVGLLIVGTGLSLALCRFWNPIPHSGLTAPALIQGEALHVTVTLLAILVNTHRRSALF